MTQTTGQMSGVVNYLAVSTNGSVWTDISGYSNYVSPATSTRKSGSAPTFNGDTHVITFGEREPIQVTFRVLYTEDVSAPFDALRTAHETAGGGQLMVRWAPKGNTAGNQQFTTGTDSKLVSLDYPTADKGSADPIALEFAVMTAAITTADIATA